MKYLNRVLIAVVLSLLGVSGLIAQSKKPIDPVYDKAKDETTYFHSPLMLMDLSAARFPLDMKTKDRCRLFPPNLVGSVAMVIYHKTKDRTMNNPEMINVGIKVGGPDKYLFDEERDLSIVFGTEKIELGRMALTERKDIVATSPCFVRYVETLELSVPVSVYRRILASDKVKFKVEDLEFNLSKAQIKMLKTIADEHFKS